MFHNCAVAKAQCRDVNDFACRCMLNADFQVMRFLVNALLSKSFQCADHTLHCCTQRFSWLSAVLENSKQQKPPASPAAAPRTVKLGKIALTDPYRCVNSMCGSTRSFEATCIQHLCSADVCAPCSWLSDYQRARDPIVQEQFYFKSASKRLAPLQQQLLSELRQHVKAHQVGTRRCQVEG